MHYTKLLKIWRYLNIPHCFHPAQCPLVIAPYYDRTLRASLGLRRIKTQPSAGWNAQQLDDMLFYGVLGVVLGGRLGYVLFYQPAHFLAHPLEIFAVWQGGMAFHGGFLGVLA
ncbi:MAG: prolipoprotein diacylglyceryl transferase family protein, partial [Sulfuricellaceae bacterium]